MHYIIIFCYQNKSMPITDSTRILFATWWLFILILTSFYTANLTAFLTKPQFTLPINNLQDIVRKGYQWVTYKGRTIDFLLHQVSLFPNLYSILITDNITLRFFCNLKLIRFATNIFLLQRITGKIFFKHS